MANHPQAPELAEIVADLRLLRERGLVRIRHTELAALRHAVCLASAIPLVDSDPGSVEALLRLAVANLGEGSLGSAAAHSFGLNHGARDRAAQDRRRRAAQEYGVSVERFRKHHERIVIEQVAEEILKLCAPRHSPNHPATAPELAREIRIEARAGDARFPVTVHVEPVELLRDVDVVVAPTNMFLEMPQPYKASVSAALRRASARRAADGAIVEDVLQDELRAWIRRNGRPGLAVSPGTVVPTSAGELAGQGIRRVYHTAIASPRPGTNDYEIDPVVIATAVRNIFAAARAERALFLPRLASVGLPLLGAGRGGLDRAASLSWMWAALERELAADGSWHVHFITRRVTTADFIVARLRETGASC